MKKIEFKPIIITIILILFQSICFAVSKMLSFNVHLIGNSIDDLIPFNIYFMIPYMSWYILLFVVPYYLYKKDKDNFTRYCIAFILMTIITNIVFVCYPTTVNRPDVTGTDILSLLTRFIFWVDTPVLNCFPSQHCAVSMLFILYVCMNNKSNKYFKLFIILISISIMASTLFVKQHVFIDFVSGVIVATCVYFMVKYEKKLFKKFKEVFKL